ncbi:MAG TPA: DMT family transporter [Rhodocyclaceae bacterium]
MGSMMTYGLVALAAVFWGANFNLSKPVVAELHPLLAGAERFLIAAILMLAVALIRGERVPLLRQARAYGLLGLVGVGGFNLFFFYGMGSTSAVNGALIMALNPLLTAVLAWAILGERPSLRQGLAFPIGLAGVAIVVLGGGAGVHLAIGDLLLLIANLNWALYNVLCRRLLPAGVSGTANTAGIMVAGALVLWCAVAVVGVPLALPGPTAGAALSVMAVGGSVLAYMFWNAGISKLGTARTAIFINLVPVASMIIASLGGHLPTAAQLLGGAIVIGAVSLATLPAGLFRLRAAA